MDKSQLGTPGSDGLGKRSFVFPIPLHQPLERYGIEQLYSLRHTVQTLRSITLPLSEVCATLMRPYSSLELIPHDLRLYFRDTHDHLSQIVRTTESARETLFAAMQIHLSLLAVQQNEIVKRLAGWGAIVFVPTLVGSIYGMNFQYMPELQWSYGYPAILLATAAVCLGLYRRFTKYDWLSGGTTVLSKKQSVGLLGLTLWNMAVQAAEHVFHTGNQMSRIDLWKECLNAA